MGFGVVPGDLRSRFGDLTWVFAAALTCGATAGIEGASPTLIANGILLGCILAQTSYLISIYVSATAIFVAISSDTLISAVILASCITLAFCVEFFRSKAATVIASSGQTNNFSI